MMQRSSSTASLPVDGSPLHYEAFSALVTCYKLGHVDDAALQQHSQLAGRRRAPAAFSNDITPGC
jgi:hypothetical protein